jgi:endonuclease YncB( thermonuclease family)
MIRPARWAVLPTLGLYLFTTLGCASSSGVSPDNEPASVLTGQVVRVVDGDTLVVQLASGPLRVRLYAVDAPEKQQPYGKEAAAALAELTAGKPVSIEPIEQDRYERLVGIVHVGDTNVNSRLVSQGHAWAYRRYMRKADAKLCSLEDQARRARQGLWSPASGDKVVAPWDWRAKTRKHVSPGDYQGETVEKCVAAIGRR